MKRVRAQLDKNDAVTGSQQAKIAAIGAAAVGLREHSGLAARLVLRQEVSRPSQDVVCWHRQTAQLVSLEPLRPPPSASSDQYAQLSDQP
jgi:hypothetical protein